MNIRDIARLANVTPGTVSKVLNNYPDISEATRQHVLQIIKRESVHHKKRRQKVQTGCYTTYWTCLGKCLQLGFRDNAEPAFRALSQRRLYCFILSG